MKIIFLWVSLGWGDNSDVVASDPAWHFDWLYCLRRRRPLAKTPMVMSSCLAHCQDRRYTRFKDRVGGLCHPGEKVQMCCFSSGASSEVSSCFVRWHHSCDVTHFGKYYSKSTSNLVIDQLCLEVRGNVDLLLSEKSLNDIKRWFEVNKGNLR